MQQFLCSAGSNINQYPKYNFFSYHVFRLLLKVPMILFFLFGFQHTKYCKMILFSSIISDQIRLVNNKTTILVFIGLILVFLVIKFFGLSSLEFTEFLKSVDLSLTEFRKVYHFYDFTFNVTDSFLCHFQSAIQPMLLDFYFDYYFFFSSKISIWLFVSSILY